MAVAVGVGVGGGVRVAVAVAGGVEVGAGVTLREVAAPRAVAVCVAEMDPEVAWYARAVCVTAATREVGPRTGPVWVAVFGADAVWLPPGV